MKVYRDRISIRQAMFLFVLLLGAPSLRVVPNYVSRIANTAGWVSPVIAFLGSVILVFILNSLFKKKNGSLYDVYEDVFGKFLNKIISLIYIGWCIFLAAFYLRMYGERFIETIIFDANIVSIIVLMAIFVLFIVNQKIDALGRMSEILLVFFVLIVVTVFLIVLPDIKLSNLWPVTHYDLVPAVLGAGPLLSLSVYITAVMFLGNKIGNKKEFKKISLKSMMVLFILNLLVILSTIGLIGYRLNSQLLFPYFATLKNIEILNTFEHIESLVISIWLGADVAIISFFTMVSLNIIKQRFNKVSTKNISFFVILIIVIISIVFTKNVYEAEKLARLYIGNVNLILFGIMPFIAAVVGKIRKVI